MPSSAGNSSFVMLFSSSLKIFGVTLRKARLNFLHLMYKQILYFLTTTLFKEESNFNVNQIAVLNYLFGQTLKYWYCLDIFICNIIH